MVCAVCAGENTARDINLTNRAAYGDKGGTVRMDAFVLSSSKVTEGESLAQTLKKSGQFPPTMIHMVSVGEKAGQLEQMLERVPMTYENEVDLRLGRLTAMLEPLMLVAMGAVLLVLTSMIVCQVASGFGISLRQILLPRSTPAASCIAA